MNLTIAIPTMPGRESTLSRLLHCLEPQVRFINEHSLTRGIEVVVISGPGGLGNKINQAFALPPDEGHVVIVDDDDLVRDDFVRTVLDIYDGTMDYIGWDVLCTAHDRYWMTNHTRANRFGDWKSTDRGPSVKCAVRKAIGRQIVFGNSYEADKAWCRDLVRLIRTHDYIDAALYRYDWWEQYAWKSEGRDVGMWPFNPANFTFIEEQT